MRGALNTYGMLSRELSAKMDFCDKMVVVAVTEMLSVDFKGESS